MPDGLPASAISTLMTASAGLLIAGLIGTAVVLIRIWKPASASWLFPLLVICYALPPSAMVIVGQAFRLTHLLELGLVVVSISFPMSMFAVQAADRAALFSRRFPVGSDVRRLRLVSLPYVLPDLLSGLATCMPWAMLATLLAEIASADTGGLGLALMNSMQLGFGASRPYIIVAALISVLPYGMLLGLASLLRVWLNLPRQSHPGLQTEAHRRLPILAEVALMTMFAAIVWTMAHLRADILVPDIIKVARALNAHGSVLFGALFNTLFTTILSVAAGILLGGSLALAAHNFRWLKVPAITLLLPLQILPLIIFVPLLFQFNLILEDWLFGSALQPPPGIVGAFPGFAAAFIIAGLATGYVAYNVVINELERLPLTRGSLIEALPPGDLRRLQHIQLPWAIRATPLIAEIAAPRALLAVLVVEVLATRSGLGGHFAIQRAGSSYTETWTTLLFMLIAITVLTALSGLLTRHQSNYGD